MTHTKSIQAEVPWLKMFHLWWIFFGFERKIWKLSVLMIPWARSWMKLISRPINNLKIQLHIILLFSWGFCNVFHVAWIMELEISRSKFYDKGGLIHVLVTERNEESGTSDIGHGEDFQCSTPPPLGHCQCIQCRDKRNHTWKGRRGHMWKVCLSMEFQTLHICKKKLNLAYHFLSTIYGCTV